MTRYEYDITTLGDTPQRLTEAARRIETAAEHADQDINWSTLTITHHTVPHLARSEDSTAQVLRLIAESRPARRGNE